MCIEYLGVILAFACFPFFAEKASFAYLEERTWHIRRSKNIIKESEMLPDKQDDGRGSNYGNKDSNP